ncbi:MAG: penicillin acylase family protein, partial [Planctomycetaceae bacterium]|nr:penicillin acylase family protein [Planctomycetaceae bacterium]
LTLLKQWTGEMKKELVAPTLFNTFFQCWCDRVAAEHFDDPIKSFMSNSVGGVAARLLHEDNCQWFETADRVQEIRQAFYQALGKLTDQLGDDLDQWTWGRIQVLRFPHVLAERGDLGQLLNPPAQPVDGDMVTVCNTGLAATGAGYRLIHDLGSQPPEMIAIDCQSQSGHPGSPHYHDQFSSWAAGQYHRIGLDREDSAATQTLIPR